MIGLSGKSRLSKLSPKRGNKKKREKIIELPQKHSNMKTIKRYGWDKNVSKKQQQNVT